MNGSEAAADLVRRTELLQPGPAEALGALLGVDVPDLARDGLPLLWHWLYTLDRPATADLGRDGHPVRGTVPAPPEPGRRRMWAGGSVVGLGPLLSGREVTRRTSVETVEEKTGRSGRLTFVTVRHRIEQDGRLAVDERQHIVYRDAPGPTRERPAASVPVVPAGVGEWEIPVGPTLLFRYSALTYNAHRIHYDRDYAITVEGYPGLVVHGPLQAVAMAEAARVAGLADSSPLTFTYRLLAPLFDHQGLVVSATEEAGAVTTSARDLSGRLAARGVLTVGTDLAHEV